MPKRGNTIQLCGRVLAETLNMLCEGQYYDPEEENTISKRYAHELPGIFMSIRVAKMFTECLKISSVI